MRGCPFGATLMAIVCPPDNLDAEIQVAQCHVADVFRVRDNEAGPWFQKNNDIDSLVVSLANETHP